VEVYTAQVTLSNLDKRVITSVGVMQSQSAHESGRRKASIIKAMWDTGCTDCCVSRRLVRLLGLQPVGETGLKSAHDDRVTKVYSIDIKLPGEPMISNILAAEIDAQLDFDIIIGLDIIRRGNFHLDNVNGTTVFTFSLPALSAN